MASQNEINDIILAKLETLETKLDNVSTNLATITQSQKDCQALCLPKLNGIDDDIYKNDGINTRLHALEIKAAIFFGALILMIPIAAERYFSYMDGKEKAKTEEIQKQPIYATEPKKVSWRTEIKDEK